jgi:hypothetical protein
MIICVCPLKEILLLIQIYIYTCDQMAKLAIRTKNNADYLYLSLLVIASASLVTLILYGMYYWYRTGIIPVAGVPAPASVSEDTLRFVIGSLYVPLLIAFAGIAIASRLKETAGHPHLSLSYDDGKPLHMTLESNSYVLDISRRDTVNAVQEPADQESDIFAGEGKNQSQHPVCPGPAPGTESSLNVEYRTKRAEPPTAGREDKTQGAEVMERDLIEQLKDPVKREKLVSLLLGA